MGHPAADDRVTAAISNWAPRFTANGVTAGDFDRITQRLRTWDDWCSAWSAVAAEHEGLGRDALKAMAGLLREPGPRDMTSRVMKAAS